MAIADYPDFGPAVRAGRWLLAGQGARLLVITGTAVQLQASAPCQQVMLKARAANVGTIYVGASNVTNSESSVTGGLQLGPGDAISFPVDDLANVWINGTAGDGVSFICWT